MGVRDVTALYEQGHIFMKSSYNESKMSCTLLVQTCLPHLLYLLWLKDHLVETLLLLVVHNSIAKPSGIESPFFFNVIQILSYKSLFGFIWPCSI